MEARLFSRNLQPQQSETTLQSMRFDRVDPHRPHHMKQHRLIQFHVT